MTQKLPPPLPVSVRIVDGRGVPTPDFHRFMSTLYDWLKDHLTWKASFSAAAATPAGSTWTPATLTSAVEPGPLGAFTIVSGHLVVRDAGTYSIDCQFASPGTADQLFGGLSTVATAANLGQIAVPAGQTVTLSKTDVVLPAGATVYAMVYAVTASPVNVGPLTLVRTGA